MKIFIIIALKTLKTLKMLICVWKKNKYEYDFHHNSSTLRVMHETIKTYEINFSGVVTNGCSSELDIRT